jgi:hypothetical protein
MNFQNEPWTGPRVATIRALIVCIRFSARSNTTALVVDPLADLGVAVVQRGQAVQELVRRIAGGLQHAGMIPASTMTLAWYTAE